MKNRVHHTQYNQKQWLTAHEESNTAPLFVHVEISNFGLVVSRFLYDAPRQSCFPVFFAHYFLFIFFAERSTRKWRAEVSTERPIRPNSPQRRDAGYSTTYSCRIAVALSCRVSGMFIQLNARVLERVRTFVFPLICRRAKL